MTNKQKIEILKEYRELLHELDLLMESYLVLRAKLISAKIPQLKQDVIQCSMSDKQSEDLAEMVDLEQMIMTRRLDIINAKKTTISMINTVDNPDMREILIMRYLQLYSWDDIINLVDSSWARVFKLHNLAIENISVKIIDCEHPI